MLGSILLNGLYEGYFSIYNLSKKRKEGYLYRTNDSPYLIQLCILFLVNKEQAERRNSKHRALKGKSISIYAR